jgi:hypothetical protein
LLLARREQLFLDDATQLLTVENSFFKDGSSDEIPAPTLQSRNDTLRNL